METLFLNRIPVITWKLTGSLSHFHKKDGNFIEIGEKSIVCYTEKNSFQSILWNYSRVADTGDYRTKFYKIYGTSQDKILKFQIFS